MKYLQTLSTVYMLITLAVSSSVLLAGENLRPISIDARSSAPLPPSFNLQIENSIEEQDNTAQQAWLTMFFSTKGIEIIDDAKYTLYIDKFSNTLQSASSSGLTMRFEGEGNRMNEFNAGYEKQLISRSGKSNTAKPDVYGIRAKLEGPGGLPYWTVNVTAQQVPESERLSDEDLLKQGLKHFGRSYSSEITKQE